MRASGVWERSPRTRLASSKRCDGTAIIAWSCQVYLLEAKGGVYDGVWIWVRELDSVG